MTRKAESSVNYALESFDLHYYSDTTITESRSKLYNDDGESPYAFENGNYELLTFSAEETGKSLLINIKKIFPAEGSGKSGQDIRLKVHNINSMPAGVKVGNSFASPKEWSWSESKKLLEVGVRCPDSGEKIEVIKTLY